VVVRKSSPASLPPVRAPGRSSPMRKGSAPEVRCAPSSKAHCEGQGLRAPWILPSGGSPSGAGTAFLCAGQALHPAPIWRRRARLFGCRFGGDGAPLFGAALPAWLARRSRAVDFVGDLLRLRLPSRFRGDPRFRPFPRRCRSGSNARRLCVVLRFVGDAREAPRASFASSVGAPANGARLLRHSWRRLPMRATGHGRAAPRQRVGCALPCPRSWALPALEHAVEIVRPPADVTGLA